MSDVPRGMASGSLSGERPHLRRNPELFLDPKRERERGGLAACEKLVGVGLAHADALQVSRFDCDGVHDADSMSSPYFSATRKVCCARNDLLALPAQNMGMEYNHLRAWRLFRHMTLDEVAAAIGSTKATVQQLEVGRMTLSHKWLVKIAPVLGTTPGMLLDHDPNDLPTSVLETWAAIPSEDQPKAMEMLKVFARTGTGG
jgi:transcriptional regulator with XRE-family HTH domain